MDFKQFDFLHLISVSGWEHLAEKAWAFGLNLAAALLIFFGRKMGGETHCRRDEGGDDARAGRCHAD